MSVEIPVESKEYLRLGVTVDGLTPTVGVRVAVLVEGARPASTDWQPATLIAQEWCWLVQGLARGTYDLWVEVTDSPEVVVVRQRLGLKVV